MNHEYDDVAPLCISVDEAAELLGISRNSGYKQCHVHLDTGTGGIPCKRVGKRILVNYPALVAMVMASMPPDTPWPTWHPRRRPPRAA